MRTAQWGTRPEGTRTPRARVLTRGLRPYKRAPQSYIIATFCEANPTFWRREAARAVRQLCLLEAHGRAEGSPAHDVIDGIGLEIVEAREVFRCSGFDSFVDIGGLGRILVCVNE
jgi:hypothetical protein